MTTQNTLRTVFLMTLVFVLFLFVGFLLGGQGGMIIAFIFALGMNFFSYWKSDKLVLKMYNAEEVDQQSAPKLYNTVRELAEEADLPMPKVYIIPQKQPNAFATGRNPENSAVAVTRGIMDVLDWDELRGVLAHELAHVKNRDILTQTIVSTVVGAITMLSQFAIFIPFGNSDRGGNPLVALLVLILAPLAASMLHSAVSRTREYEADRGGAIISGNPRSLASALQKIEAAAQRVPMQVSERTAQSTSHMFPVNPFSGGRMMRLFSTHPPTEERIEKLNKMAETGKYE